MNAWYVGWVLLIIGGFLGLAAALDVLFTAVERRAIRRARRRWQP